jgi:hypothetical protein
MSRKLKEERYPGTMDVPHHIAPLTSLTEVQFLHHSNVARNLNGMSNGSEQT